MSAQPAAESPKKERTFLYTVARILSFLGGHTIFPVKYHDTENYALKAPYIVIANHQSWMDPLIVAKPCKDYEIRFVGKKELNKGKIATKLLSGLHMITVDRHNTDLAAMRQCTKVLKEGKVLGIFPEGTRHLKELMETVETGSAVLALRAQVPLVPVYVKHPPRFLRMNHVYVGKPMDISDLCAQGFDAQTVEQLTNRIQSTFRRMRDDSEKKS